MSKEKTTYNEILKLFPAIYDRGITQQDIADIYLAQTGCPKYKIIAALADLCEDEKIRDPVAVLLSTPARSASKMSIRLARQLFDIDEADKKTIMPNLANGKFQAFVCSDCRRVTYARLDHKHIECSYCRSYFDMPGRLEMCTDETKIFENDMELSELKRSENDPADFLKGKYGI